jgi:hypothetical protein
MKFIQLTERDQSGSDRLQPIWVNPLRILWFQAWNLNAPDNGTRIYIVGQELSTWVKETTDEVARLVEQA